MKKGFSRLAGFFVSVSVLLCPVGCATMDDVPLDTAADEVIEAESLTLFGMERVSAGELEKLKSDKSRVSGGDGKFDLYFNECELAGLGNGRVFYMTIPRTDGGWSDGELTVSEGYRAVVEDSSVPDDPTKMIEYGNALMVYLIGEEDYAIVEIVMTYLPIITINIDENAELDGSLRGADFTLHDSAAANRIFCYAESRAEVKYRGGSSSSLPKKSIRIDLKDENGDKRKLPLFGMRNDDDWILTAMFSDESKVRDMTAWQLWREMKSSYPDVKGSCAPETRYVEVILNGKYQGLYMFMEKFDAKTMELEDGDALFKATSWEVPDSAGLRKQHYRSLSYYAMEKKWPSVTEKIEGTWDGIAEYIRVAYETDGEDFAREIADVASVENQLDYWIFNNVTMASDNTFKNAYYAVKDGLVYTLPWDLDISFGLGWNGDGATNYLYRNPDSITRTYDFQAGRRLIKYYDGAADYVKERWQQLTESGVVTAEGIIENARAHYDLIRSSGALTRERERWSTVSYADDAMEYFESSVRARIKWLDKYINELE